MADAPKIEDYFNTEKVDIGGWRNAVSNHDNIADLVGLGHQVREELSKGQFAEFVRSAQTTFYDSLVAQSASEHLGEEFSAGDIIPDSHYEAKIHQDAGAKTAFERAFIRNKGAMLSKLGITGYDSIDVDSLDDEERQQYVLEISRIADGIFGSSDERGEMTFSNIMQSILYNPKNTDVTMHNLYNVISDHMGETHKSKNFASLAGKSALQRAMQLYDNITDHDTRADTVKEVGEKQFEFEFSEDAQKKHYALTGLEGINKEYLKRKQSRDGLENLTKLSDYINN